MILPFPIRIPVFRALLFTCLLVIVQLTEGTDPRYSFLVFCFFMMSVFAFNVAGGFSRPSGAYIFFYSLLVVVIGTVGKAVLGEAAQTHLVNPLLLMLTYLGSITGMFVAAFMSRRIATTTDGIAGVLHIKELNYSDASLGCVILFLFLYFGGPILPGGGGQILHSLQVINPFLPLSILLGTVAAVRESNGWRSTNTLNLVVMGYTFYLGMITFTKQGMFTPITCWIIALAWTRFRLRPVHLAFIGGFAVLGGMVLGPMSQVGRNDLVTYSQAERAGLVYHYFTHVSELRRRADLGAIPDRDRKLFYYDQPRGLLDRLSMMPGDAVLIDFSNQGHYFGFLALRFYFQNWVPHILNPHKLEGVLVGGNTYMHELGGLADEDTTTGISFSPTAESFHIGGWPTLLLIAPGIWLLLFVTSDAACGDIRKQPLGLLYVLVFAHVAPEGGIGGSIDLVRLLNAGFIIAISFCGYVAPVIGMLLRGRAPEPPRFAPMPADRPFLPEAFETS